MPIEVDWTYNERGEIIDVNLFPSDITEIPVTSEQVLEMAAYESLARLNATEQKNEG